MAGVFHKGGIAGLEEDLDAVERTDYGFGLGRVCERCSVATCAWDEGLFPLLTAHPARPPASPLFQMYSGLCLFTFLSRDGLRLLCLSATGAWASPLVADSGAAFCRLIDNEFGWAASLMMRGR